MPAKDAKSNSSEMSESLITTMMEQMQTNLLQQMQGWMQDQAAKTDALVAQMEKSQKEEIARLSAKILSLPPSPAQISQATTESKTTVKIEKGAPSAPVVAVAPAITAAVNPVSLVTAPQSKTAVAEASKAVPVLQDNRGFFQGPFRGLLCVPSGWRLH